MKMLIVSLFLLGCARGAGGVRVATVAPRPDDVASIDGIVRAFYAVVNLAPDEPRQWARDRTLYSPWIRFVGAGGRGVELMDHQQLVNATEPMIAGGFRERELARVTRRYGHIAHVFSTYETERGAPPGQRSRGVNSLELYFDGARWWISAVSWQSETAEHPIPPELLP